MSNQQAEEDYDSEEDDDFVPQDEGAQRSATFLVASLFRFDFHQTMGSIRFAV
jgi:hypothetical protein